MARKNVVVLTALIPHGRNYCQLPDYIKASFPLCRIQLQINLASNRTTRVAAQINMYYNSPNFNRIIEFLCVLDESLSQTNIYVIDIQDYFFI